MSDSTPPSAPPTNDSYAPPAGAAGRMNGLAIASLVVGIVSFFIGLYGAVGVVAIILGVIALRQVRERGQRGRGLAIAGIILGAVGAILTIVFLVVGRSMFMG